jgi:hypothetical protein
VGFWKAQPTDSHKVEKENIRIELGGRQILHGQLEESQTGIQ